MDSAPAMRTAKKAGQRESSTTAFAGGSEADSSSAPDAGDIIGLDGARSTIGVRVHVGDDPASTPTKSRPAAARPTADAPTLPTREVRRALKLVDAVDSAPASSTGGAPGGDGGPAADPMDADADCNPTGVCILPGCPRAPVSRRSADGLYNRFCSDEHADVYEHMLE